MMMNNKRNLFTCFIVLVVSVLNAQEVKIVSGEQGKPLPDVTIQIQSLNKNFTGNTVYIVNEKGEISFNIPDDHFPLIFQISHVGYENIIDTLFSKPQSKTYKLQPGLKRLDEVVVTGQYAPGSAEKSVHKVRVIDEKKIASMAAVNLKDVLTNELNVRLSYDNILGSSMSLQGISGENVKILIDNVPIIGRQNGNIDLSQINLNNIERIEIIEGPMSVSYGTNALAGTINLITKKAQTKTVETALQTFYESTGNYNINARLGLHHKQHTVLFSGGRNFFDGWNPGDNLISLDFKAQPADSGRYNQWKPREQYFAEAQYIFRFKNLSLNYRGNYFDETIYNRGIPRAPYGKTAFDDTYKTKRIDNALFLSGEVAKHKNINFLVAYNHYNRIKNTFYKDLTTLSEELSATPGDQDTSNFTLLNNRASYATSNPNAIINYEAGYDINYETTYGKRIKDSEQVIGDYAVFASAEYRPLQHVKNNNFKSVLIIRPGLRYAYNTDYKAPLIPSANLKYSVPLKNDAHLFTTRFSYARGFRSPSLKELYFYFVDINHNIAGNSDLKSEYSNNYSLSATFSGYNKKAISYKAEINGFYNDIKNLISLAQTTGAEYSYINVGYFKTLGIQANGEMKIKQLTLNAGLLYTGRYNRLSEVRAEVNSFTYTPEIRLNATYDFAKQNFFVSAFYKYSGAVNGFALNGNNEIINTSIEDYSILDLTIGKWFWKKRIGVSAGSKNVLNVTSLNITGGVSDGVHSSGGNSTSFSTGRTIFLKLDFNFNSK